MDITTLAAEITKLLAAALPYFQKSGEKAMEEAATQLGTYVWDAAQTLWRRLQSKTEGNDSAKGAVEDLKQAPEDEDLQAQLRVQLKKLLSADEAFAQELVQVLQPSNQETSHHAQQNENSVLAQGKGAVAAKQVAVGGRVEGSVTVINIEAGAVAPRELWELIADHAPPADLEKATEQYLQNLLERYRFLDFRGMGISDRVPLKLPLLQMYVPLKARQEMPEGDTWARELRLAGRKPSEQEREAMGQRLSEPQPLLQLLRENAGLIILGDPGAGKTTFLKFLTLALATGQSAAMAMEACLPVLLPLSAYANALADADVPLDRFIARYYRERGVRLPLDAMLEQALAKGGALLLLDGLDEVKDLGRRHLVVDRVVDFFTSHCGTGNKFVITSRVVGYPEVRPRVEGLAECTIVDLDDEEIAAFVEKWSTALEQAARGETRVAALEAAAEGDELLASVRHNPGVRSLAANPLLLTILALMKRQGVTLPERRVELYQKYVDTLLYNWNLARSLAGRGSRQLDVRESLRTLAPLALWMHRASPGVGLVKEGDLRRELEQIYRARGADDPTAAADAFLEDVRGHSGLLIDRGGRHYGFIHLTFQEYLAGVALAQRGQQEIEPIVDELAAHLGDDNWHEVSLLCIGYLSIVQQRDQAAGAVSEALLTRTSGGPGEAAVLVGEALNDVGAGGVPAQCRTRVEAALVETLQNDTAVPANRRAKAGQVLGDLGDPRPGVLTLDDMAFCLVPPGPFLLGSQAGDKEADEDEQFGQECNLPYSYWIARFPVTVAQFRLFIAESGQPPGIPHALLGSSNQPVVEVNWHEALAFCHWLTQRWRRQGWLGDDRVVTLPSEVEWEKAARGGLEVPVQPVLTTIHSLDATVTRCRNETPGRGYPWRQEGADPNRANYADTVIVAPSAVGCFPGGTSLYGCEEMSGNVWEWTRSRWNAYPYPSDQEGRRNREDLMVADSRVLRGGSFSYLSWYVRCAYRDFHLPEYRHDNAGFRVVVSPFLSER